MAIQWPLPAAMPPRQSARMRYSCSLRHGLRCKQGHSVLSPTVLRNPICNPTLPVPLPYAPNNLRPRRPLRSHPLSTPRRCFHVCTPNTLPRTLRPTLQRTPAEGTGKVEGRGATRGGGGRSGLRG